METPYRGGPGITDKQEAALTRAFALDLPASIAAETAGVSRPCAHRRYNRFREAIYRTFVRAPRLSGVVEVDIVEFGGKGRKKLRLLLKKYAKTLTYFEYEEKAKHLRNRYKTRLLVFAERSKEGAKLYAQVIPSKRAGDLLPLVRLVVKEGSLIVSDKEPGLSRLKEEYRHRKFVSGEFKSKKGLHTANVDAFASFAKRRLAKFNGLPQPTVSLHVKECLWRYSHRDKSKKALEEKLQDLLAKQL